MAWISVYDTVDGPKLRNLRKKLHCNNFEALGILNYLWLWGLENADKDGHIINADEDDIARYLYGKGSGCKLDTSTIVIALINSGWIDRDEEGLIIHDWDIWQEQWYKARERRESDARRKRESRKRSAMGEEKASLMEEAIPQTAEIFKSGTVSDAEKDSKKQASGKYEPGFEAFWAEYPRKYGKGEARKKYLARRKEGYSDAELLMAAKNYGAEVRRKHTEQQYIKHAKTFLSDALPFLDYIPKNKEPAKVQEGSNPFAEFVGGEYHR